MYDAYVSLGSNCEAGFQLKRINYNDSNFFRWTLSSYKSTFNLIQNDFKNLYQKENLVPVWDNMVEDSKYKISFHSKLLSKQESDNQRCFLANDNFDQIYQEECQKIKHFVSKWFSLVNSNQRVLYIIKQENQGSKHNAKQLLELFKAKYPNHNFMIAYIQHENQKELDWGYEKLKNIYFPRFAPISQADQGDISAWDQIFKEFPLNQKLVNI